VTVTRRCPSPIRCYGDEEGAAAGDRGAAHVVLAAPKPRVAGSRSEMTMAPPADHAAKRAGLVVAA